MLRYTGACLLSPPSFTALFLGEFVMLSRFNEPLKPPVAIFSCVEKACEPSPSSLVKALACYL